jgi:putative transposase
LGRAVSAELAASTITLKDLQAARNKRRRELRTELNSRRSLVDALRHPVPQTVPENTVTPAAPRGFQPEPDRPATKPKLYREN